MRQLNLDILWFFTAPISSMSSGRLHIVVMGSDLTGYRVYVMHYVIHTPAKFRIIVRDVYPG